MGTKAAVSVAAKHSTGQGMHALPLNTQADAGHGTNREDRQPAQRACFTGACWCTSARSPTPAQTGRAVPPIQRNLAARARSRSASERARGRCRWVGASAGPSCAAWGRGMRACGTHACKRACRAFIMEGLPGGAGAQHAGRRPQGQHSRQLIRTYECSGMYVLSLSCAPCKKTRTHVPTST